MHFSAKGTFIFRHEVMGLHRITLSLLKEPVILFLRELRVLFTFVPLSTFSIRSSSSSFLVDEQESKV